MSHRRSRPLRPVVATAPALVEGDGTLQRLVGSTDARGRGTAFDIAAVGPYVLVGAGRCLARDGLPGFGDHPHAGLVAVSHVPRGGPWRSRSNVPGSEDLRLEPGHVLVTLAGRGITHDEWTLGDEPHELNQLILRLPGTHREVPPALWSRATERVAPGVVRLFDRDLLRPTGVDAEAYQVDLTPGRSCFLPIEEGHLHAFVFARTGAVAIGPQPIAEHEVAVLGARGSGVEITAGDEGAECLVALAAPIDEPWAKLVGYGGFVVAADPPAAEAKLAEYADSPARFGVDAQPRGLL